jgi:hypothetical protein
MAFTFANHRRDRIDYGTSFTIVLPSLKVDNGWAHVYCEDGRDLFIHHEGMEEEIEEKKCRFCSKMDIHGTHQKCGRCSVSYYCSKQCQEQDWKILKHKIICDYDKDRQIYPDKPEPMYVTGEVAKMLGMDLKELDKMQRAEKKLKKKQKK